MNKFTTLLASIAIVWGGSTASAEILAMMNYESKTPDQVKALKLSGAQERREGMHVFDVSGGVLDPKLLKTIETGEGAHHVAFTKDGKYAFVQNSLLTLPGMADGSITVIDLAKGEAIASMDTLKNAGLNPNLIVLLPEWNDFAGH